MSVEASLGKLPISVTVSRRTGPRQDAPCGILYIVRDRTHLPQGVLHRDRMCSLLESEARSHVASKLHKRRKSRASPVGQHVAGPRSTAAYEL